MANTASDAGFFGNESTTGVVGGASQEHVMDAWGLLGCDPGTCCPVGLPLDLVTANVFGVNELAHCW